MNKWKSGRMPQYIEAIKNKSKKYEGRLYRGKFKDYRDGDIIDLHLDISRENGQIERSALPVLSVRVLSVSRFDSFSSMLGALAYENFIPDATSQETAVATYIKIYSENEEKQQGVLAIEIEPLEGSF